MKRIRAAKFMAIVLATAVSVLSPLTAPAMTRSTLYSSPPYVSPQANQTIEGFWQGTLDTGAIKLRLAMKFTRTPEGTFKGLLDSLDQGANDIPMGLVTFQNGALHAEMNG